MMADRSTGLWFSIVPVLTGFVVLALAGVALQLYLVQAGSLLLAALLIWLGARSEQAVLPGTLQALACLLVLLLGAPLLAGLPVGAAEPPLRWLQFGPLQLYSGGLLMPAILVLVAVLLQQPGSRAAACGILLASAVFLALQPDAAQLLALTIALPLLYLQACRPGSSAGTLPALCFLPLAVLCIWTLRQQDMLSAVPYVEGVFALALNFAWWSGLLVIAAAVILLLVLYRQSLLDQPWLAAVAVYYAVLYGGSVAGATPAPLLGYGAAPVLGFGLMLALSLWLRQRHGTWPDPGFSS